MNERDRRPEDLLRAAGASSAVEAARRALAGLEPREVPVPLRRVKEQNRPSLPYPLESRLLQELEEDEWFREQAAEQFEGSAESSEPEERAGALFLFRPEGWEAELAETARSVEQAELAERAEQMSSRIDALELELEDWRNQAKRHRQMAKEAAEEADRREAKVRDEAWANARKEIGAEKSALLRENQRLKQEAAAAAAERDRAREGQERARQELEKERRVERTPPPDPGPNAWADREPIESARFLDEVVEAHFPAAAFRELKPKSKAAPLALPPGVNPSDPAAVEWLLALDRSFALLVDGYNVGFHVDNERFHTPVIRRRLETSLELFKNLARGWPRVTVVYDSCYSGETTVDFLGGEIQVMFTNAGRTADDELVSIAAEQEAPAVVVSSDKEVQKGAGDTGALVLFSESLAGWILRR